MNGKTNDGVRRRWITWALVGMLGSGSALATERIFTYTYEPEVFPRGASEFEQWVTWLGGRDAAVGQTHYSRWEMREEFEYGFTDNYTASFYLNGSYQSFTHPDTGNNDSRLVWDGISMENRYMLLNPAEHPIGLTLYAEPRVSDRVAEMETKILLGQRFCEDWKWALNLGYANEWPMNGKDVTEGEVEMDLGIARSIGRHWTVGIEVRDHNELPKYDQWENTALYIGPAVSYRAEAWWAALSVLPQVYGQSFQSNPSNIQGLDLEGHERINIRLIVGFGF
jgi:hypothetical protein